METSQEFAEGQVRRLMTVLFISRARRHLRTLAAAYGWSPETLAAHEARFIRTADFIPVFSAAPTPL